MVERWEKTYFGESVLFGCFFFAFFAEGIPDAAVDEAVPAVAARSLAVTVVGTSETVQSELWGDVTQWHPARP